MTTPDYPPSYPTGLIGRAPEPPSDIDAGEARMPGELEEAQAAQWTATHPTTEEQHLVEMSYNTFGDWSQFMARSTQERILLYVTMAALVREGVADDRTKRLLAWGMRHDRNVSNALGRVPENNPFQIGDWFQVGAIADFMLPGDQNAVTTAEATEIAALWENDEPTMRAAAEMLGEKNLADLGSEDPRFAELLERNWMGDEQAVDAFEDMPLDRRQEASGLGAVFGNIAGTAMSIADWLPFIAVVKGAATGVKGLSALGRAATPTAARAAGRGAVASTIGALDSRQLAAWHLGVIRRWMGRAPSSQYLWTRNLGRTAVGYSAAIGGANYAVQSAYDLWLRDVTPTDVADVTETERTVQANVADAAGRGLLDFTNAIPSAMRYVRSQISQMQAQIQSPTTPPQPTTATQSPGGYMPVSTPSGMTGPSEGLGFTPTGEALPTAPPPYIGGMPDQYVRDAEGNITSYQSGYSREQPFANPSTPGTMVRRPQYREGDVEAMLAAMSPAEMSSLTAELTAAGYDIGFSSILSGGTINQQVVDAFSTVLGNSNWNATDWQTQIGHEITAAEARAASEAQANWIPYGRFTYLPPDYDTLAQNAKATFESQLGRPATDAEKRLFTDAQARLMYQSARQQYEIEKVSAEQSQYDELVAAGTRPTRPFSGVVPIEDPSTGGINPANPLMRRISTNVPMARPEYPEGMRAIDVEASIAEWFDQRYGDEADLRSRMGESAQNFATMMSGSDALRARVRREP
jgi:hypothetical protein